MREGPIDYVSEWVDQSDATCYMQRNTAEVNLGVVASYQALYERTTEDILCYFHDDVSCYTPDWDKRVLAEFEDPTIGVVGFGGAKQHGSADIYKTPYHLQQLGRSGYLSNVDDAEVHGQRFEGSTDVAVLDGFALCVRRELLDKMKGWSRIQPHVDFFCYDYALCAMAHRLGYRVRVLGLKCHHHGGRTSVVVKDLPITSQKAYDSSHAWFYKEFRDVIPWRCP